MITYQNSATDLLAKGSSSAGRAGRRPNSGRCHSAAADSAPIPPKRRVVPSARRNKLQPAYDQALRVIGSAPAASCLERTAGSSRCVAIATTACPAIARMCCAVLYSLAAAAAVPLWLCLSVRTSWYLLAGQNHHNGHNSAERTGCSTERAILATNAPPQGRCAQHSTSSLVLQQQRAQSHGAKRPGHTVYKTQRGAG